MSLSKQESDRLRQLQGNTNPTPAELKEMESLGDKRHDPDIPVRSNLSHNETARLTQLQAIPRGKQTDAEVDELNRLLHRRDAEPARDPVPDDTRDARDVRSPNDPRYSGDVRSSNDPRSHAGLTKQEADRLRQLQGNSNPTTADMQEIAALTRKRDNG
jgi:ribosomal protein L35